MKHAISIVILLSFVMLFAGCATAPKGPLPEGLKALNPGADCPREPQAGGWDIKAQLVEVDTVNYLALYFEPGFHLQKEPDVRLRTGFAVFEERDGNTYYYRLGKLPNVKTIGSVSFTTPVRKRAGREFVDERIKLKLERKEDSDCLRIIVQ